MTEAGTNDISAAEDSSGCTMSLEVLRKKVLLQILAIREAERLGIAVTPEEVTSAAVGFRNTFGLNNDKEFGAWLDRESIPLARFERFMHQFVVVAKVESFYGAEIDLQIRDMSRIDAARLRNG